MNHIGINQRRLGRKFGVVQSTIHSNLKKIDLKYYKCQKAPKYNKNQLEHLTKKCRKMRRQMTTSNTFISVDDEKYLTFSNDKTPQSVDFNKKHV